MDGSATMATTVFCTGTGGPGHSLLLISPMTGHLSPVLLTCYMTWKAALPFSGVGGKTLHTMRASTCRSSSGGPAWRPQWEGLPKTPEELACLLLGGGLPGRPPSCFSWCMSVGKNFWASLLSLLWRLWEATGALEEAWAGASGGLLESTTGWLSGFLPYYRLPFFGEADRQKTYEEAGSTTS